jgi:hypothetical protein
VAGATQTSAVGPVLAFGGAIIVAVIAAATSIHNVRKQLDGERRRQEAAQSSARLELQERLDHDRRLVDIQHLREFLDEAAAALEEARADVLVLSTIVEVRRPTGGGMSNEEEADAIEQWQSERLKAYARQLQSEVRAGVQLRRVEMRFPSHDPVAREYAKALAAVQVRADLLEKYRDSHERLEGEDYNEDINCGVAVKAAIDGFAKAARQEIGVLEAAPDDDDSAATGNWDLLRR